MRRRSPAFAESLVVWGLRRRYLRQARRGSGVPEYGELAAESVARLSINGVRELQAALKVARDDLRNRGDDRTADSLTIAIRDLDSRVQILDDLLR